MPKMRRIQSFKNKRGEVDFRRKLAKQFSQPDVRVFPGEPFYQEYINIVKDRIKDYQRYFVEFPNNTTILNQPYLEIGAGVGQGSMLLKNKYHLDGFASDLSFETLQLAPKYLRHLKYKKMPFRVCCDAYNLPFADNSMTFVFCFETLHHLPDPFPVLKEIKRVLKPGGFFYFNEEPISQTFNLNLWRRDRHLKWFEKILKYLVILHFISRIGKSEIEYNILEETFNLKTWEKSLNLFESVNLNLTIFPFTKKINRQKTKSSKWIYPSILPNLLLNLLGGGIGALCQKQENNRTKPLKTTQKFTDVLACPNCKNKPKLKLEYNKLFCNQCKTIYHKKNGIFILLPKQQIKKLYPNEKLS